MHCIQLATQVAVFALQSVCLLMRHESIVLQWGRLAGGVAGMEDKEKAFVDCPSNGTACSFAGDAQ